MIAVLIPAYNAASSLLALINATRVHMEPGTIIVVDDGSTDTTSQVAREARATVLSHPTNRGKGAALRTGFRYFLDATSCDSVITMDADLQHDPADGPAFVAAWKSGSADIILGSRRRLGSGMPLHRILSNTITSALVSARTGIMISDSQTGYRLIGRNVLTSVEFESDGYEAETEYLIKAARRGFRIASVPISTIYAGAPSHMTHWKTTMQFLHVLLREYE